MDRLERLLREARTIELVDWPDPDVPATLHRAGYLVLGHEPDGFKHYHVSDDGGEGDCFALADGSFLVSSAIPQLPERIDIVGTYRPPDEQFEIARAAVKIGARGFWVEPGEGTSDEARSLVTEAGLEWIEGEGIAAAVRRLQVSVAPFDQPLPAN
jgi:ribosomal protein S16